MVSDMEGFLLSEASYSAWPTTRYETPSLFSELHAQTIA